MRRLVLTVFLAAVAPALSANEARVTEAYREIVEALSGEDLGQVAEFVSASGLTNGDGVVSKADFLAELADTNSRLRYWLRHGSPNSEYDLCLSNGRSDVSPRRLLEASADYQITVTPIAAFPNAYTVIGSAPAQVGGRECQLQFWLDLAIEDDGRPQLFAYEAFLH